MVYDSTLPGGSSESLSRATSHPVCETGHQHVDNVLAWGRPPTQLARSSNPDRGERSARRQDAHEAQGKAHLTIRQLMCRAALS
jgi:hypothetical protein